LRLEATVLTLCLISLTACDADGSRESTRSGTRSTETTPKVQSSLEGLTVLPSRIRWTATTSVPAADVREVRFFVDHERWWVDRSPPYSYGPEGADLPTRFISSLGNRNDTHSFTLKVITKSGERSSETVEARTPEASLARHAPGNFGDNFGYLGYWGFGRLSAANVANPPRGYHPTSYTGWLDFVHAGLFTGARAGKRQFAWEMASDAKRIYLGTPIFLDAARGPASNYGYRKLKASLCPAGEREATYAWSVRQGRLYAANYHVHYLELRPLDESCDARRRMLEGVWEEVRD
jgi:hypothetical protein